jgi:TonB family protein
MLALMLSHLLVAQGTPAYLASCPKTPGGLVSPAVWVPPDDIHATNRRARFFIDLGSDGRVRRAAVVESSGDARFDAAAQAAIMSSAKYAAPSQNCITTSSVTMESFNVPLISLVTPAPANASAPPTIPTSAPAASIAICSSSFVQLTSIDVPVKKAPPGTVSVDVGLSAAAKVTSVLLAKSSGNKELDYLGTTSARSAGYTFMLPPGCAPKPTTYRLELTYR